ncbi:MAG: response regulator [Syntrophaceae bacterium]|nr:response regulator [Syntrophaceae bacterium]
MKKRVLVIDDDRDSLALIERLLTKEGFLVRTLQDSSLAIDEIMDFQPHVVLLDIMMPKMDGFTLLGEIKGREELSSIKTIVVTAKKFEFDYKRSFEEGADAYIVKPISNSLLVEEIDRALKDTMKITFWGTRGTIPKPGKDTLRFGGNTPCVSVEMTKDRVFIFDAGTGIINLGSYLLSLKKRLKMNLFITHPHWDHIHGFPYFKILFLQGNELAVYGSPHGGITTREIISGQMDNISFPITIKEFASRIYFNDITEGEYEIEGLAVKTISLNHPGVTLGYRLTNSSGKSMAYITDNELVPDDIEQQDFFYRQRLVGFLKGVDVLIHDASYFDDEYKSRVRWGHSPITEVLRLAEESEAKSLYLFHHEPDYDDDKVAEMERIGQEYFQKRDLNIQCFAAAEGESISL